MRKIRRKVFIFSLAVFSCAAAAQNAPAPDYSSPSSWLCRPDRQDACGANLDATAIQADGSLAQEPHRANPQAPIDCFYVYPTISNDPGPNSDLQAQPDEEPWAALQQFARLGTQCRLFAPLYRQITLTALRGQTAPGDFELAYRDVRDAWNDYLARDNRGRGFVLVGHSQGSRLLKRLIQEEIDGKPLQKRLVSAILAGHNVMLPSGKDAGGDLKNVPVCRAAGQTGCVIAYVSFRKTSPPPADSRFGKSRSAGLEVACTNPAALAGGVGALKPYFATDRRNLVVSPGALKGDPWIAGEDRLRTPYVTLPNYVAAQCVQAGDLSYLEIAIVRGAGDARRPEITGDVISRGALLRDWGLHVLDVNLAMGNLVEAVAEQSRAYLKQQ